MPFRKEAGRPAFTVGDQISFLATDSEARHTGRITAVFRAGKTLYVEDSAGRVFRVDGDVDEVRGESAERRQRGAVTQRRLT